MYYLKQSYSDQIIICNPQDEIILRVLHYDFKTIELALEQAENIVNILNNRQAPVKYLLDNLDYTNNEHILKNIEHYLNYEN